MRNIDYTDKLKDFRNRLSSIDNEDMLEYDTPTNHKQKVVAVISMPESVNALEAVDGYRDRYNKQEDKINACDAPASDIICDFINFCEKNWDPYDANYDVLVPHSGIEDFSFLQTELNGYNPDKLVVITVEDFEESRQIIVVTAKILLEAIDNGEISEYIGNPNPFDDILFDNDTDTDIVFDNDPQCKYEQDIGLSNIEEIDPNDRSIKVIQTMEPTEPLEDYLKNSKVWIDKISNDKQKIRDAHANIIVTLRDVYLQTFEQIAKLLNDYYGVTRTRQSIHSLYERVKKREASIVDYETQREILLMRLFGLSISKIHDRFPQLTEYGIGEIINSNKRETDELKDSIIDTIAKKLVKFTVCVGKYRACDSDRDNKISQKDAFVEIKRAIGIPSAEISEKVFNEFIDLAVERIVADRLEVMASVIYESHVPGLKSAKSFMEKHGISNSGVTARKLKDIWTN